MRSIDADELREAIEALYYHADKFVVDEEKHGFCTGISVAVRQTELMPTIEAEPRWIPCSERLPEEQQKCYWVCTDSGYQCECRWTNINHFWPQLTTEWHWHFMDTPQYAEIVAWMPLPEPYKEGE